MRASRGIKRFRDLRSGDLEACRVWQYIVTGAAMPANGEQPVRPLPKRRCIREFDETGAREDNCELYVAASFWFADGSTHLGIVVPAFRFAWTVEPSSIEAVRRNGDAVFDMKPCVMAPQGPLALWRWHKVPKREELDSIYRALKKRPEEIFPLRFQALVPVSQEYLGAGVLPGFVSRVEQVHCVR